MTDLIGRHFPNPVSLYPFNKFLEVLDRGPLLLGAAGGLSFSPVDTVSADASQTYASAGQGRTVLGIWAGWTFKDLWGVYVVRRQDFVGSLSST